MDGPFFATTFVNKLPPPDSKEAADDHTWRIFEKGKDLYKLTPGETVVIESFKPTTDWARWSRVVLEKDRSLSLTENPAWQNPWLGQFHCIELINKDASDEESIAVVTPNPACVGASGYIHAPKGIPQIIPLDLWDPLVRYSAIIWERKPVRKPIEGSPYFHTVMRVEKVMVPRSKAELKKILAERAAIEAEKAKTSYDKMMKKQEALLGMGEEK